MNFTLSIITINFNDSPGLDRTMTSIFSQTHTDFEYIVIDGGSTDSSLSVLQKFQDIHDRQNTNSGYEFQWVSETDSGIYNAMNKGIMRAKGEYCLFVNSGDVLYNDEVINALRSLDLHADIITGNAVVSGKNEKPQFVKAIKDLTFYTFFQHTILHQATLIRSALFREYGYYNENIKIIADWEFFVKSIFLHNCTYKAIDVTITSFNSSGISSQPVNFPLIKREREEILSKYFPYFLADYRLLQPNSTYIFLKNIKMGSFVRHLFTFIFKALNKLFRYS